MSILRSIAVSTAVLVTFFTMSNVQAQTSKSLRCGDILEGEVVKSEQTIIGDYDGKRYGDTYVLNIAAGTKVNLVSTPLGNTFNVGFAFLDSSKNVILAVNKAIEGEPETLNDFALGSSKQMLVVVGLKPGSNTDEKDDFGYLGISRSQGQGLFFGAYELRIGCTLRDGTVIEPGEATANTSTTSTSGGATTAPFTGVGFPGLAPVDFSNVAKIPMIAGTPMTGAVTVTGSEVLGYIFDGKASTPVELTVTRLSGNLNLGVVVLSEDNKVVYQASLVTSTAMTTTFPVPADGKYTVGVFRIDLLPPAAPEATAFQVQVK
jgi:hypothetical protein